MRLGGENGPIDYLDAIAAKWAAGGIRVWPKSPEQPKEVEAKPSHAGKLSPLSEREEGPVESGTCLVSQLHFI